MRSQPDTDTPDVTRRSLLASAAGSGAILVAGCLGSDSTDNPSGSYEDGTTVDEYVLVASVRDDPADITREWEPFADWLEAKTETPTRIDSVQSDSGALAALGSGQAHLAYPSGGTAWVGWQNFGLETIAAEADADGRTSYTAAGWVRVDSDIETVEDLAGVDSCHTGDLKGAGMLIPTAHLAQAGLVSFDDGDDITAIRGAVHEFFGEPLIGGGYIGALQCLSQGHGEVAFVRASTPEDFCGGPDAEDWCLDLDEYELLVEFAEVPSHPIMVSPDLGDEDKTRLQDAILALNDDPEGRAVLDDVFGVHGFEATTSEAHLGPYGELIEILPGIEDHLLE